MIAARLPAPRGAVLAPLLAAAACAPAVGPPAELVVLGEVHTAAAEAPAATGLAVRDGRFVFVGDAGEAARWIGPETGVIEAGGAVLPGLIDGHVHLESGLSLVRGVDLTGIADRGEWVRRIAARAEELGPGAWIVGGRWDHTLSEGGAFPSVEVLDPVTPENPVALSDIDGHTTWANSLALEIAGIGAGTPDPPGGRILRYASGAPTGILLEAAGGLVTRHVPPLDEAERRDAMQQVFRAAARLGLTGVHTMASLDAVSTYVEAARAGELPLRVWFGATGAGNRVEELAAARDRVREELAGITAADGPRFEIGYAKLMADGVLSARTAALLEPYADAQEERGFLVTGADDLRSMTERLNAAGIPVSIHAIGDRAVRVALDAFAGGSAESRLPNRIEHIEVIDPADVPRFRELGVLASFNPHHCITGIGVYNTDRLGPDRAAWSFAWGGLLDAGASLVFGSDWATAPLDPLRQLYAATVREKPGGGPAGGWHPGHRLGFEDALRAYTIGPARAAGQDDETGSIEVGKRADFVILSGPVPDPPDRSWLDLRVESTWISGRPTFRRTAG